MQASLTGIARASDLAPTPALEDGVRCGCRRRDDKRRSFLASAGLAVRRSPTCGWKTVAAAAILTIRAAQNRLFGGSSVDLLAAN